MEDISDDNSDPFVEEEEEDEEEQGSFDSESDEGEDINMPRATSLPRGGGGTPNRKKSTPKKTVAPTARAGETSGEDLSARMNQMDISAVPMFCMDWTCPFILSTYNEDVDIMIKAQVLVPIYPKEYFIPDVGNGGMQLEIRLQVPSFFVDEARILESNAGQAGFNVNTYQAQSFKDVCEQIDTHYGMLNNIFGATPMIIALPFACEERLVDWEIQAYPNDLGTLTDDLGGQQFHACLSITLRKHKTKRKTTGGFRVVGGPP